MEIITVTDMTFNVGFIYSYFSAIRPAKVVSFQADPYVVIEREEVLYKSSDSFLVERDGSLKIQIGKPTDLYSYSVGKPIPYSIIALFSVVTRD